MTKRRAALGIKFLAAFFAAGALISLTTATALLLSGGPLDLIWRLKPTAQRDFAQLGHWAILLMAAICSACAMAAFGLWRQRPWGRRFAAFVLALNLVGDSANAIFGREPSSALGVPIAAALIFYLLRQPPVER
jgi:hypothetical protein